MTANSIDWHALSVSAAFVVGALVGTIATIRLFRVVIEFLQRRDRPDD